MVVWFRADVSVSGQDISLTNTVVNQNKRLESGRYSIKSLLDCECSFDWECDLLAVSVISWL